MYKEIMQATQKQTKVTKEECRKVLAEFAENMKEYLTASWLEEDRVSFFRVGSKVPRAGEDQEDYSAFNNLIESGDYAAAMAKAMKGAQDRIVSFDWTFEPIVVFWKSRPYEVEFSAEALKEHLKELVSNSAFIYIALNGKGPAQSQPEIQQARASAN